MNSTASASLHQRTTYGTLMRLMLATMLLAPLAVHFGENIVSALLPAFWGVFEWVADDFKLLRLTIDNEGADRVLRATVMWKHITFLGGHVIYPDPRGTANASTLLAHALQGPLVALVTAFAWPTLRLAGFPASRAWNELAIRLLLLLPLLALLIGIDMPVVLAGEIWHFALDALAPGTSSFLVQWKFFMQGGGRYALGFGAAVAAVQFAQIIAMRNWLRPGSVASSA
jgi:hypothetical protein